MLFVGSFQHPPNADAVRYACQEILPLVPEELRREHPLYVVGDSLDETVRAYARRARSRAAGRLGPRARAVLRASARGARATSLWGRDEAQGDSGADGQRAHGRDLDRRGRTRISSTSATSCSRTTPPRSPPRPSACSEDRAFGRRLAACDDRRDRATQRRSGRRRAIHRLDAALAREPKPPSLPRSPRRAAQPSHPLPGGPEVRAHRSRGCSTNSSPRRPRSSLPTKVSRNCFACTAARCFPSTRGRETEQDMLAALERSARAAPRCWWFRRSRSGGTRAFNTLQTRIRQRLPRDRQHRRVRPLRPPAAVQREHATNGRGPSGAMTPKR